MIIAAVAAAVGVLGCALAAGLLWKKKLTKMWGASLLACALIVAVAGGAGVVRYVQAQQAEYGYIYLALRYLEQGQTDPAALYLKRVTHNTGYELTAAQALLEQVRGNSTVAQLRLNMLENTQDGSKEQDDTLTRLETWQQMENGLTSVTAALREQLPLSQGQREELDRSFALESGSQYEQPSSDAQDALLLQVNQSLGRQDWYGALDGAVQLVRQSASASNRLLLAEVIADVTYCDGPLSTGQFADGPVETDTQAQEAEDLMLQYEQLMDQLAVLEQEMALAPQEEQAELASQNAALSEQAEEVQRQAENIFALRALNSIADIHSLEAQVVRARLYFAMRSYQEAVDTLCQAAGSVQSLWSGNQSLVNGLTLVQQIYDSDQEVGVDTPEFRETLLVLLGSVHPDLIYLGLTPLATDFADRIISDQQTYGSGLYVVGLDASRYPEIQVRLGGREEVMDAIVHQNLVALHDTRSTVETYEASYDNTSERLNSLCFVVDTSGSMGGAPIQDAREALDQFLNDLTGSAELSLVQFESSAQTLVELTTSVNTMKAAVNGLSDGGGTNISAGIAEGTAALSGANGARTMIVMTDGQSDVDMGIVQSAVDQGITIFTIGFGDVNDELLQSIADLSGGQYLRADSSTELMNVYSSLQGLIGNTITVTYTVEDNPDEDSRYFYLMDEERNLSVRRSYYVGPDLEQETTDPVTLTSAPVMQTRANLDRLAQQADATFQASYGGTGLDTVAAAYVGDTACAVVSQSEDSLRLDIPAQLANGWYEVRLQTRDGAAYSFPDMLVVGDQLNCRSYRAGGLELSTNQALWLDGTLVLGNSIQITQQPSSGETVNTLDLRLAGTISIPGAGLPAGVVAGTTVTQDRLDQIDLGDAGSLQGRGTLSVSRSDKAYAGSAGTEILDGSFTLEYSLQGSRFRNGETGEEAAQ